VFTDNDVVKVDLGARKGAYLGDCAMTIDLTGGQAKLIEASEEALEEAISMVKAGRKVCEIGAAVEKVAGAKGFRPIRNLGGHGVSREDLHARIFIPNYDNGDETALEEGEVIAIEPFMTDGEGRVKDGASLQIYQKVGSPAARLASTRVIADFIDAKYSTYPFALRWLFRDIGGQTEFTVLRAIADLSAADALDRFPVLVERRGGMVAQAEKEMIVEKDGCSVITA
jgi:methionyl aminopeptidase